MIQHLHFHVERGFQQIVTAKCGFNMKVTLTHSDIKYEVADFGFSGKICNWKKSLNFFNALIKTELFGDQSRFHIGCHFRRWKCCLITALQKNTRHWNKLSKLSWTFRIPFAKTFIYPEKSIKKFIEQPPTPSNLFDLN